jgi:putative FmdB family regulatory protein
MASYDLKCRSCENEFEVFMLGFLKDDAKVCPDCGSHEVDQRFTGFGGVMGFGSGAPSCVDTGSCQPQGCTPRSGFS